MPFSLLLFQRIDLDPVAGLKYRVRQETLLGLFGARPPDGSNDPDSLSTGRDIVCRGIAHNRKSFRFLPRDPEEFGPTRPEANWTIVIDK